MSIDDELKRRFYMEMARIEHWDTRTLDEKIDGMLYERTALSRKPEELIEQELQQIGWFVTGSQSVCHKNLYGKYR